MARMVRSGSSPGSIAPLMARAAPVTVLQGELAEERQAQVDVVLRQPVELLAAAALLLEGNDLAQPLHRVDRKGAELAGRFACLAAQSIDALAHQEGAEADGEQERQQRQRQPGIGRG